MHCSSPAHTMPSRAALLALLALLLALLALARCAPTPAPAACASITLLQSAVQEAVERMDSIPVLESALIPVNTMEKGCIHSHLTALLSALHSHNSHIAKKLENVHEWTKQQSEFHRGSDGKCKTVEALKTTLFKEKTLEFLRYLSGELRAKWKRLC